jgi:hypothetical protein
LDITVGSFQVVSFVTEFFQYFFSFSVLYFSTQSLVLALSLALIHFLVLGFCGDDTCTRISPLNGVMDEDLLALVSSTSKGHFQVVSFVILFFQYFRPFSSLNFSTQSTSESMPLQPQVENTVGLWVI